MTRPSGELPRWAVVVVTLVFALLAYAVQWGVVTTKLAHVETRLDELIAETRGLRSAYADLERRMSFLEGQHKEAYPPGAKK